MMAKANGTKSRHNRRTVASRSCLVCGRSPCDPHHHPVRVSHGGKDSLDNMVPLCREHHRAFHDGEHQIIADVEAAAPLYFERYGCN